MKINKYIVVKIKIKLMNNFIFFKLVSIYLIFLTWKKEKRNYKNYLNSRFFFFFEKRNKL